MSKQTRRTFLKTSGGAMAITRAGLGAAERSTPGGQDLVLWYQKPAAEWADALPVGNGHIGAMMWGGNERGEPAEELIQLNHDTLWSGFPRDGNNRNAKHYLPQIRRAVLEQQDYHLADRLCQKMQGLFAEAFQPVGNLRLQFEHARALKSYRRELDLDAACAATTYEVDGAKFTRELFASAPDGVLVFRVATSKPGTLHCTVSMDGPLVKSVVARGTNRLVLTGKAPAHVAGAGHPGSEKPVEYSDVAGEGMFFAAVLEAQLEGGTLTESANALQVKDATALTIVLTMHTGFHGFDRKPDTPLDEVVRQADAQLTGARGKNYAALKERQQADHRELFRRVSLRLGSAPATATLSTEARLQKFTQDSDPSLLALYFHFGRYLLICSSRRNSQPANLQGIWNAQVTPPWSSNWTANINVQMNYWPAEACNLSDCTAPLFDLVNGLSKTGRQTAGETYGLQGWVTHHNIDLWRAANPVGEGVGQPTWANWCMSGAWLCQHLYDHYLFTRDRDFLRATAYPSMKGAAEFCLAWLIDDGHGRLTTCPSESTENDFLAPDGKPAMTSAGCTMDMALIRELFGNCIAASKELGIDAEFAGRLAQATERLLPYRIGKYGQLQEWSIDFEEHTPGQRHMSHLYPLYPGSQITVRGTPALAKAARTSLERRLANGGAYTGWSRAWAICFWARLGDGDKAWESLRMLMLHSTNKNLFDTHPAEGGAIFQIDGNFGATAAMAEMLLQSHTGTVELLPALPAAWAEGEVTGLRARGALTVDLRWSGGKLHDCTCKPDRNAAYKIRAPHGQRIVAIMSDRAPLHLSAEPSGDVACRLDGGRAYKIRLADI